MPGAFHRPLLPVGQPTPNSDPTGEDYAFEKGATRFTGQAGWADVWRRDRFAPDIPMELEARRPSAHPSAMSAALIVPPHMTVAEFLDWEPDDRSGRLWQLRDGEPEMMAPASDQHGSIQSRLSQLIGVHLDASDRQCRVVTTPGVVPAERAEDNCLVPDLGITCTAPTGAHLMEQPLVLIEILSPTNVSKTRANVRAYRTIPTVVEIVVVHSTVIAAEILRRAPDGAWPYEAAFVGADGELRLDSIGFAAPLRDAYRTTSLA